MNDFVLFSQFYFLQLLCFFFLSSASDTATENQKNTTVTDQNTISLSVSDESKSTALTDSVDNSPQSRFE